MIIIRYYNKPGVLAIKKSSFTSYETDDVSKNILNNSQIYLNRCLVCLRSFRTAATWCVGAIIVPQMYF